MRKKAEMDRKFHKKSKRHLLFAGTGILLAGLLLGISMFSQGTLQSIAKGYVKVENGNTQNTFWYGFTIPYDFQIWQHLRMNSNFGKTYEYGAGSATDNGGTQNVDVNYSRTGDFKLEIEKQEIKNNHSDAIFEDAKEIDDTIKWKDSSNADCNFTSISEWSTNYKKTYYRVIENGGTVGKNWGDDLMNHYAANYNQGDGYKKALNYIVTNKDTLGSDFNKLAKDYLTGQGFAEYTSGQSIPLTKNGKPIAGVEMVTVLARDFYYNVKRGDSSAKRVDLDIMLYTSHNYKFNYTTSAETLKPPTVSLESGSSIENGDKISRDDSILLAEGSNPADTAKPQYYLSDEDLSESQMNAISNWTNYSQPFNSNGKRYLYVRNNYKYGEKKYIESNPVKHKLQYMDNYSAIIKTTPEVGEYIDVGSEIQITQNGAPSDAAIFYSVDAEETPTLKKVSYANRQSLNLDNYAGEEKTATVGGKVYLKINGLWYECSDDQVKQYKSSIVAEETLRINNYMTIYVLVEDTGKEVGVFQALRFSYKASGQTEAPQSSIPTSSSEPATVSMGDVIELMCSTNGSQIFYTTNGSAPNIRSGENGPEPGDDTTFEYSDMTPIVVNDSLTEHGGDFLIMAQAVTYTSVDGKYYNVYQDSPVSRFYYKVSEKDKVEAVLSVPQTNSDTPVEVQVGQNIQLYSNTPGVTIFYTTDGSEPQYEIDAEGNVNVLGNTQLYNGASGVTVEKPTSSSLFTITALAYKDGMTDSDISRLVFAYPGAVSAPYANPTSGSVTENTEVILQSATDGAIIYYEVAYGDATVNDPTTSSKVFDVSNPIKITQKITVKAYAVKDSIESTVSTFNYTVASKLKTPTPSIETGTVISSGTVISLSADKGATIYYTLDGSDPRDSANKKVQVGSNVVINGDAGEMVVLRTYAAQNGYTNSEVGTYSYNISAYAGGIYADKADGEIVKNGEKIHLHTDMSDAEIYYTTDGSAPTKDSHSGDEVTIHGEPGEKITIMAIAIADGSEQSTAFATFTYTIMEKVAAPTSSVPDGAIFTKESMVELKAETGRIYYTTDGSDPTTSSNLYKKSIVIDGAVTIRAIAVADDLEASDISTFNYGFAEQVAAPIASYASGELEMGTKVTFTSATEGATIYYRTDGKDINLARKNELEIYKEPITINQATNFKVIAVKDKMQDSNILKVGYTVKEPVVIEAVEEEGTQNYGNQSNRLQSRRSFSDTESGPSYKDVVLRNATHGAIVAAEEGTLPDQVQLIVESTNVTDAVDRRVKQVISESFGVVASYDVSLLVNGEEAQPEGTIEIGLPIPVEYENAMIYIVHVQEDGNIELFETRRSGGVAYAKVDHLSVFSITAPVEFDEEASAFPWLPVAYTLAVGLTGIGIWLIYKAKKQRREEGMQDV